MGVFVEPAQAEVLYSAEIVGFGSGGDNYLQYGEGSEHNLTMMQQLQAERRQRFFQFQKRKKGNILNWLFSDFISDLYIIMWYRN